MHPRSSHQADPASVENRPRIDLYRRIVKAKLFIDSNFHETIDVDDIADEASYSKFHFIRTFREIYGKTPHQYLIEVRVEHAKKLLADGRNVTDACMRVGFDSMGSFAALFKRRTGSTPSQYRLAKLLRRQQMLDQPLEFIPGCIIEQANARK